MSLNNTHLYGSFCDRMQRKFNKINEQQHFIVDKLESLENFMKEMEKKIEELQEQLYYLPPGGGPGYQEAEEDFDEKKET